MHNLTLKIALSSYLLFSIFTVSHATTTNTITNTNTNTYSDTTITTKTCTYNFVLIDCDTREPIDTTVNGLSVADACPERKMEIIYGRFCNYRIKDINDGYVAVKLQHAYDGAGFNGGQGLAAAYGMNDNNNVVGQALTSNGDLHAVFLNVGANEFSDHYFYDYGQLGLSSSARAINNLLTIVGETQTDSHTETMTESIWHSQIGLYRPLNALGVTEGVALDLARNSMYKEYAVGYGKWTNGAGADGKTHGFIWSFDGNIEEVEVIKGREGQPNYALAINDSKAAVGSSWHTSYRRFLPAMHRYGTTSLLYPNYKPGSALDINNNKYPIIAGYLSNTTGTKMDAVYWTSRTKINYLKKLNDADISVAKAVSDARDIVGHSDNRAVIWRDNEVYDLNSLVVSGANSTLTSAIDINRHGRILAEAEDGFYMLIPTEEPGVDTL